MAMWQEWFAWYPVLVRRDEFKVTYVWLEHVLRLKGTDGRWTYRLPH